MNPRHSPQRNLLNSPLSISAGTFDTTSSKCESENAAPHNQNGLAIIEKLAVSIIVAEKFRSPKTKTSIYKPGWSLICC